MATAVYYIMQRHSDILRRKDYSDIEEDLKNEKIKDAFKKLKWDHDVFDAEYLVKKTKEEKEYEEVIRTISNLRYNPNVLKKSFFTNGNYILLSKDLDRKNTANVMREYWIKSNETQDEKITLKRK